MQEKRRKKGNLFSHGTVNGTVGNPAVDSGKVCGKVKTEQEFGLGGKEMNERERMIGAIIAAIRSSDDWTLNIIHRFVKNLLK